MQNSSQRRPFILGLEMTKEPYLTPVLRISAQQNQK